MPTPSFPGRRAVVAAALALGLSGCGGAKYPVQGTVALDDGTPVTKGLVVFERVDGGPPVTARGHIGPDGRYALSTDKPGDGVPPGRYKVLINPLDLSDVPDEQKNIPFDFKYMRFETSGLAYEVTGGPNEFSPQLARSRKRGR